MKTTRRARAVTGKAAAPARVTRPRAGRPQAEEGVERRKLLLNTALELFAVHGIGGTSLHAIADKARVTPALVHYYFGNKQQLLDAVIAECLMPIVQQFNRLLDTETDDPLATLYTVAQQMLVISTGLPWLPALWVREVLSEGGSLRKWMEEHRVNQELNERVCQLTKAAQKKGQLSRKLDPRLMIVSLAGLTLFPLAGAPMWQNLPGNKNISLHELSRHMLELLAHGIEIKSVEVKHGSR